MKLKKLLEEREKKQEEMKKIIDVANTEERALNEEEQKSFEALEAAIRDLDATIRAIQAQRELEQNAPAPEEEAEEEEKEEAAEERAFDAFLRDTIENREASNMTMGANGAVVPASIAKKIIDKVVDMCPIYQDAERYNVTGTLTIPYYDDSTSNIKMEYADEFTEGESKSGKFGNISLTGFLARAICDVSKSLINNSLFNLVDFVINKMAQQIALFIEKELLVGTPGKVEGLSSVTKTITTESATAVTTDELIDLQESIPDAMQMNAYWIMNKKTRTAIRKLKDKDGNYILNKDATARWGYTLFGKDVYTSDNMDEIGAGKTPVYYGDMSGLAVKVSEEINIEVLRETKARQHAVEVLGFVEFDAKVQDAQRIAKLVCKSGS